MVKLTRNHYRCAKSVTWEDVMDKINCDQNVAMDMVGKRPTFVCRSEYTPKSMKRVLRRTGLKRLYVFTSFLKDSDSFGRHKDDYDVLLIQSIGKMSYMIEGSIYEIYPGDSLFIPNGTYHTPHPSGPRVTLSLAEI